MNKKEEILEIIDGFKNLTSKIKEDNDAIKNALKNKDLIINACKKEYRKLYAEHEELKKKKYAELETRIKQNEVEKVKIERKRKNNNNDNNKRKKKVIIDYNDYDDDDADDEDEKNSTEEEEDNEEKDDDYEIVKVKRNKKTPIKPKKKQQK